jgi:hypothetical protein
MSSVKMRAVRFLAARPRVGTVERLLRVQRQLGSRGLYEAELLIMVQLLELLIMVHLEHLFRGIVIFGNRYDWRF